MVRHLLQRLDQMADQKLSRQQLAPLERQRATALVRLLAWLSLTGTWFGVLYHVILRTHAVGLVSDLLTASCMISLAIVLTTGRFILARRLFFAGALLCWAAGVAITGIWESPFIPWTPMLILWFAVMGGTSRASMWSIPAVLAVPALAVVEQQTAPFPRYLQDEGAVLFQVLASFVGIGVMLVATMVFEQVQVQTRIALEGMNVDLKQALDQARNATRDRDSFLATLSHEIRTPLNGMFGVIQLMELDKLSPNHRGQLAILKTSATNLLKLLDELLDLSKLEAGQVTLQVVDFDPREVFDAAIDTFRDSAQARQLVLLLQLQGLPDQIAGDPNKMLQVLHNLIGNAVKLSPPGEITIRAEVEGILRIEVLDRGPGLRDDDIQELFEPFKQGKAANGGSGLGLAISRRLVNAMGGRMGAHSRTDGGACFWFELPLSPASRNPTRPD